MDQLIQKSKITTIFGSPLINQMVLLQAGGLGKINYPILSDFSKKIAEDYGVLIREQGIALRGLFIADPNGVIKHITINDLPIGRSVDEVLRVVKALQFVEKHGEGKQKFSLR